MSNHLGTLDIECDAPAYPIVRACRKLGMQAPEDVRWCRRSRARARGHGWMSFLASPVWGRLLGRGEADGHDCTCGNHMPELECYSFTFHTGEQVEYQMAQCPRCRTIYWETM
jgi:hypothetical protein